jgi:recombination protein RecA
LTASANKEGENVFWLDAEGSFQDEFAQAHGVNLKKTVVLSKPGAAAEHYLTVAENAARSGEFALVVIDSLAGLVPDKIMKAELEKEAKIGEMARLMSRACPRMVAAAKEGHCAVVFINQIRMKVGVMYGNPETTPGGESLRFYSSLRLRVDKAPSKMRQIIRDDDEIGMRSKVFIAKSRFGAPYKETLVPIYFGTEKPHPLDLLIDEALSQKVISSRTSKKDNITKLTMKPEFKSVPMDEFKAMLDSDLVRAIAARLQEVVILEPDVQHYVDTVDDHMGDPTEC